MFLQIFTTVLLPILTMIGAGALLQRLYPLDLPTLSRLQIYLFIPAFLFVYVLESALTLREMAGIWAAVMLPMLVVAAGVWAVMRLWGAGAATISAVMLSGVVFNAGNYGIPVAKLQFGAAGAAVQAMVILVANLSIWLMGYLIISMGRGKGWRGALGYFRLPMIYVLAAAMALRGFGLRGLPAELGWLNFALHGMAEAVVPLALVTLGAQMVTRVRWPDWRLIGAVTAIKLVVLPAVTYGIVKGMGLWPWPGAQIVNAAAAPTAVNTLLLTLELKGDADTAADGVFWTTIASAVTVTLWLSFITAQGGHPPG